MPPPPPPRTIPCMETYLARMKLQVAQVIVYMHRLMTAAQRPSSEATSLDELHASVVRSLDGVGWVCLCGVLGALFAGVVCYWLSIVLHLCLRKKLLV